MTAEIVVAGHICLDVIPTIEGGNARIESLLVPGRLTYAGPMLAATGGAVSNTGQALHRLGVPVRLMGKVGGDVWGDAVLRIVSELSPDLADGLLRAPDEAGSYTVIISTPNTDRIFLHYPGPNDTFAVDDLDFDAIGGARLFHFGYPPLMRRMYQHDGAELAEMFARVKALGVTTSLDLTYPDPNAESGRVDWRSILRRVLPQVDIFTPSIDEIRYMLAGDPLQGETEVAKSVSMEALDAIASQLIAMGAAVVLLKLGDAGLYLRATEESRRLRATGRSAFADESMWLGARLHQPAYRAWVQGTTGAGDCAIAGFLAAFVRGCSADEALRFAAAAGAASVERPDATSGVPHWDALAKRLASGWETLPSSLATETQTSIREE